MKAAAIKATAKMFDFRADKGAGRQGIGYLRESDVLTEATFRELLCYVRKRSERSRKPLLLMLLDVTRLRHADRCAIIRHTVLALASSVPDVCVAGWYKQEVVFGAVLAGTSFLTEEALREAINNTLPQPLHKRVGLLDLKFASFPETKRSTDDRPVDLPALMNGLFYPELAIRDKKLVFSAFLKRALDIAGACAGLLFFFPFFVALPIFIKASSKGPVLFRQERIGYGGKKFIFLKFRTMAVGNDPKVHQEYIRKFIREKKCYEERARGAPVYKIKDDPRITPVGRLLRKTSLDELPQFLNVLKGDMSLVGPRPPIPYELDSYELWHRRRTMEVKPGITGLWQVNGRSSTTFDEMVRLDLQYAKKKSFWLDVKILLKTPWVVLTGKGGY